MYIPGRLRTASRPFRTLIESESYSFASGSCCSASPTARFPLNSHRHDDVLEFRFRREGHERARGRIAEAALDLRARDVVQDVEQVVDIEPDVECVAPVRHFQNLLGLFLLGVRRYDLEAAVGEHPANAAEFLV